MELVNKSYITTEESNVKFAIDDVNTIGFAFVGLGQVNNLKESDRVTSKVKVTNIG